MTTVYKRGRVLSWPQEVWEYRLDGWAIWEVEFMLMVWLLIRGKLPLESFHVPASELGETQKLGCWQRWEGGDYSVHCWALL